MLLLFLNCFYPTHASVSQSVFCLFLLYSQQHLAGVPATCKLLCGDFLSWVQNRKRYFEIEATSLLVLFAHTFSSTSSVMVVALGSPEVSFFVNMPLQCNTVASCHTWHSCLTSPFPSAYFNWSVSSGSVSFSLCMQLRFSASDLFYFNFSLSSYLCLLSKVT